MPQLAASSLKAALDRDWEDPAARDKALAQVLGFLGQVEAFVAGQPGAQAVAVARQVRDQDVDLSAAAPVLRRGVAKDPADQRGGRSDAARPQDPVGAV